MFFTRESVSSRPRRGGFQASSHSGIDMKLWTGLLLAVPLVLSVPVVLSAGDRDTAEWVIRQGGRVILSGNRTTLRTLRDLPAGDLSVTGVDLTGTLIEPKDLER